MDSPPLRILNSLFTSLELIATPPHSPKEAMYFNHIYMYVCMYVCISESNLTCVSSELRFQDSEGFITAKQPLLPNKQRQFFHAGETKQSILSYN